MRDPKIELSEEVEVLDNTLDAMRRHAVTHKCDQCERNVAAFYRAMENWLNKPAQPANQEKKTDWNIFRT